MLCFNTLGDEQIEMKKLKNRLYFISPKHLMGDFVHKALQFDANYTVIWAKTRANLRHITVCFDADCTAFQHDFASYFLMKSIIFWQSKDYKTLKNRAYLEWRRLAFQIYRANERVCKGIYKEINYTLLFGIMRPNKMLIIKFIMESTIVECHASGVVLFCQAQKSCVRLSFIWLIISKNTRRNELWYCLIRYKG